MDLRAEFVLRLQRGERITDLCAEYGISRKTGHKIWNRYQASGVAGLADKSRAPKSIPHRTSEEVSKVVCEARHKHPTWGPKKLKSLLEREMGTSLPSASTIGAILDRQGLVQRQHKRNRHVAQPMKLREASAPNDTWCIDYKGQFRLGDKSLCYPLTITDQFSRFILGCEGMAAISDEQAQDVCIAVFREHGLPTRMRSDNGVPFSCTGLAGLTQLSVLWLRLGIQLERTRPAHPEENGRHERMHRTLKSETTRPARANLLQQQERFDSFVAEFNNERPHEALEMKRPAELYTPSDRPLPQKMDEPEYPLHDDVLIVGKRGYVTIGSRNFYTSRALAGQSVGIREEEDGGWLISFMDLDLGHLRGRSFEPLSLKPAT